MPRRISATLWVDCQVGNIQEEVTYECTCANFKPKSSRQR